MKLLIVMFMLLSACVQKEESVERELVSESKTLDASYDIGRDLVLLQTRGHLWYGTKDWNPKEYELEPIGYHAAYWNPKSNEYYYATGREDFGNLQMTNGLTYEYDADKQETNHTSKEKDYLQYLGSITETERLYLGKDGNQYIKVLSKIEDPFPVFVNFVKINPASTYPSVSYTNTEGRRFARVLANAKNGKGDLQEF
ncbi:MAG: hypothetical protein ACRC0X_07215 [Brevinema sp.]